MNKKSKSEVEVKPQGVSSADWQLFKSKRASEWKQIDVDEGRREQ